ncbi:MAG: hypothetical protein ISR75_05995 [Phycisphaerales bacterium]|nr:hypothetical protein [Phycisphaerales bacterium]
MRIIGLVLLFVILSGCSMERVPASVQKNVPVFEYSFSSCEFHTFPDENISLLPNIRLIDCEVDNELAPETVEFEFTHKGGEFFGKQTRKLIEDINVETNEFGVNYYLNYAPDRGVQDSLGRWCCWNQSSDVPDSKALLPDILRAVHIDSDGGMVYRASWNIRSEPKGLAYILCGLGGMQHSSKTLGRELLNNGWAVVYLYTVLNVPDYKMEVPLEGVDPVLSAIEIFESKYCQVITATKAIRKRMEEQLPSLVRAPLVLIGISAGALNTPALFNELQDEVDAVVLVAGGANLFEITQDGVFTNWKFTNNNGNRFSNEELDAMNEQYLATPSRDPYFLAQTLSHDNTLIIHAKWDKVVPSENGDLLWERAGKPERWIYPSGHLGLFMTFGSHAPEIAQWIDSKVN